MTEQSFINGASFDVRLVALLVQTAGKFSSRIHIVADERTANAKSVMGVISLGLSEGQALRLTADGDDERQAISALAHYFR